MLGNVKGYLNDNIDNNIDFLLYEVGINIKVNEIDKRAIIIDATEKINELDEKIIITNFQINQGDLIFYNNMNWLILSEIDVSKNTYRGRITKCNFDVKFPIPISYKNANSEVEDYKYNYTVPIIATRSAFNVTTNQYFSLADGEAYFTVKSDSFTKWKGYSDFISLGTEIVKFGYAFKFEGIDQTKKGLITYHGKVSETSTQLMDMANESTFFSKKYELNINFIDNLEMGSTIKPSVQILADNVDITGKVPVYYTSLTPDTISIGTDGTITPISTGTAKIKVFSQGVVKYLEFNVKAINYSINILNKTDNVGVNYTYILDVGCYKDGVKETNPIITYSSSDPNVATIGNDGTIKGIKQGIVTITANYNGMSDSMNISIIAINTINITNKINALKVGESYNLAIACTSNNIVDTNPVLTYTISDPNVLTVINGTIKAIGAGTATVVVAYKDKIDSITITATAIVYAISIGNKPTTTMYIGDTLQLSINCTIDGVADTNPVITYVSSDINVLTVSNTGLITYNSAGSATVTTIYNGVSDSTTISVKSIPLITTYSFKTIILDNVVMTNDAVILDKGTTKTIKVTEIRKLVTQGATTITDEIISNPTVAYSLDNANVTIDSNGLIKGVAAGTSIISIAYQDIVKQISIVVNDALTITGKTSVVLNRSTTYTSNMNVNWTIANEPVNGVTESIVYATITAYTDTTVTIKTTSKWIFDDGHNRYFNIVATSKDGSKTTTNKVRITPY
ncbi:hypothetical protein HBE96_17390 [Clostridium sp. P21]|uniref:BIG2 domain-containing protein n=1 Tax=Clostridium muellerianum TaxID=2716538 RepID=A0A7Y0HQ55_9CLOT|nr:Ig-like domain-containing protein [Clostridium muellerianum]NMM64397.1 hypothetical protein [Clostridium muellerianum]